MPEQMIALVTGANKGIGEQIARQLADLGHTVVVGARNRDAGERVAAGIRDHGGQATAVALDQTDRGSIEAARDAIQKEYGRLDALVNNAGISRRPGGDLDGQLPRSADLDDVRFVFETNVYGLIAVSTTMLPLLQRSDTPRIVNMSSSAGSLAYLSHLLTSTDQDELKDNPIGIGYVTSKTAVTALTLQYARDFAEFGILVNAVSPGFVATDLNGNAGRRTPEQGAHAAVQMATIPPDGPTGTFTDDDGTIAW